MTTPPLPVALLEWRAVVKGGLRGFAKVRLGKSLTVHDVPVLVSHGKAWAAMPSKPLVDADGLALRDTNGKQRYAPVLEWADRDTSNRFSAAVVEAIKRDHGPAALDETAA